LGSNEGSKISGRRIRFLDLKVAPGSHQGILLVRGCSPKPQRLGGTDRGIVSEGNAGDWAGCFVVATERKIRVIRPGATEFLENEADYLSGRKNQRYPVKWGGERR
jgi:hypothetical protein